MKKFFKRVLAIYMVILVLMGTGLPTNYTYADLADDVAIIKDIMNSVTFFYGYSDFDVMQTKVGCMALLNTNPYVGYINKSGSNTGGIFIINGNNYELYIDGRVVDRNTYRVLNNDVYIDAIDASAVATRYSTDDFFIVTLGEMITFENKSVRYEVKDMNGNVVWSNTNNSTLHMVSGNVNGSVATITPGTYNPDGGNWEFSVGLSGTYSVFADGNPIDIYDGAQKLAAGYATPLSNLSEGDEPSTNYRALEAGTHYVIKSPFSNIEFRMIHDGVDDEFDVNGSSTDAEGNKLEEIGYGGDGATFFEQLISSFLLVIGDGAMWLIGIIAGDDVSIDAILFDEYYMTRLAFFNNDIKGDVNLDNSLLTKTGITSTYDGAGNITKLGTMDILFDGFRTIAVVVYIIILLYAGIRMMIYSTAEKKADYKQLLWAWIQGLAILFLFPYVIRYTLKVNSLFISYISEMKTKVETEYGVNIGGTGGIPVQTGGIGLPINFGTSDSEYGAGTDYMSLMRKRAAGEGWICYAICWLVMIVQTISFLVMYFKRLLTVIFLITVFPLVTIGFALDKIGNARTGAFSNWYKEFFLNVFLQTFQAITYVLVMGIVFSLPVKDNWVFVLAGITFVTKGDDILRNILGQKASTVGKVTESMAQTAGTIAIAKSVKDGVKKAVTPNKHLQNTFGYLGDLKDQRYDQKLEKLNSLPPVSPTVPTNSPLSDMDIERLIKTAISDSATTDESVNAAQTLQQYATSKDGATFSNKVIADMDAQMPGWRDDLDEVMEVAYANSVIANANKVSNVTVDRQVDIVLKGKKSTKASVRRMSRASRKSDGSLNTMKVKNSIGKRKKKATSGGGTSSNGSTGGSSRGSTRTTTSGGTPASIARSEKYIDKTSGAPVSPTQPKYKVQTGKNLKQKNIVKKRKYQRDMRVKQMQQKSKDTYKRVLGDSYEHMTTTKVKGKTPAAKKLNEYRSYKNLVDAQTVLEGAKNGDFTLQEIGYNIDKYKREAAKGYKDTETLKKQFEYNIDDFEKNWAVEVLNNTDELEGTAEQKQQVIDRAIRTVKGIDDADKSGKNIIKKLEIPIETLQEGKLPIRRYDENNHDISKDAMRFAKDQMREIEKDEKAIEAEKKKLTNAQLRLNIVRELTSGVVQQVATPVAQLALTGMAWGASENFKGSLGLGVAVGNSLGETAGSITNWTLGAPGVVYRSGRRVAEYAARNSRTPKLTHEERVRKATEQGQREKAKAIEQRLRDKNLYSNSHVVIPRSDGTYEIRRTRKSEFRKK